MSKLLKEKKFALQTLGSKRDTYEEQATYLTNIASQFQSLASSARTANYSSDAVLQKHPNLKIATLFVGRNEKLSHNFAEYGHKFQYNSKTKNTQVSPLEALSFGTMDVIQPPVEGSAVGTRETNLATVYPDIEDILAEGESLTLPEEGIILEWLVKLHKESRGLELGTFDPGLLTGAMHAQSERWEKLAYGYLSDIIAYTHTFVVDLIHAVCPDTRVADQLVSFLTDRLVQKYEKAMEQAKFILHVERSNTPLTMNHYFNDNLEKW